MFQSITKLHLSLTLFQTSCVITCLLYSFFENSVGKREIAHNEQFLVFPQCFLPSQNYPFSSNSKLSSANSLNLEEFGKGMKYFIKTYMPYDTEQKILERSSKVSRNGLQKCNGTVLKSAEELFYRICSGNCLCLGTVCQATVLSRNCLVLKLSQTICQTEVGR